MKYLGVWIEKHRKKVWFALGLNLVVMVVLFFTMRPFFETNDDITISSLVNGAYDVRDAHLEFLNYLLGIVYKAFYSLPVTLPWHTFFQYLVLWLSLSSVTYVVLQKLESRIGFCVTGLLLIYFAFEGYIRMQFSKTSGIATCAALFLLFYAVRKEKISIGAVVMGWFLGCLGFMYRDYEFYICTLLMTGIGVFFLLEPSLYGKRSRVFLRCAGVFGIQMILVLGLHLYDEYMYDTDPVWSYYREYNDARSNLMDYGMPSFKKNQEAYEALGINKDAYDLYRGWSFDDPDKFGLETMNEVLKLRPEKKLNMALVIEYLQKVPKAFFGTHVFYAVLLMFLLWLFFGRHSVPAVLSVIYEVLLFFGAYFVLYYLGRYLVNRVDVGLWFAVSLVLLWLLMEGEAKLSPQMCGILCLSVLVLDQKTWNSDWRINSATAQTIQVATRNALEMVSADKDHLYLAKVNTISSAGSYGPFNRMPIGILNNICWLGGWEINSSTSLATLRKYGVENPYRDMIGNDSVYLIDDNIELTMRYIHTYYDEGAQAVLVQEVGDFGIYQIGGTNETADDMDG